MARRVRRRVQGPTSQTWSPEHVPAPPRTPSAMKRNRFWFNQQQGQRQPTDNQDDNKLTKPWPMKLNLSHDGGSIAASQASPSSIEASTKVLTRYELREGKSLPLSVASAIQCFLHVGVGNLQRSCPESGDLKFPYSEGLLGKGPTFPRGARADLR